MWIFLSKVMLRYLTASDFSMGLFFVYISGWCLAMVDFINFDTPIDVPEGPEIHLIEMSLKR